MRKSKIGLGIRLCILLFFLAFLSLLYFRKTMKSPVVADPNLVDSSIQLNPQPDRKTASNSIPLQQSKPADYRERLFAIERLQTKQTAQDLEEMVAKNDIQVAERLFEKFELTRWPNGSLHKLALDCVRMNRPELFKQVLDFADGAGDIESRIVPTFLMQEAVKRVSPEFVVMMTQKGLTESTIGMSSEDFVDLLSNGKKTSLKDALLDGKATRLDDGMWSYALEQLWLVDSKRQSRLVSRAKSSLSSEDFDVAFSRAANNIAQSKEGSETVAEDVFSLIKEVSAKGRAKILATNYHKLLHAAVYELGHEETEAWILVNKIRREPKLFLRLLETNSITQKTLPKYWSSMVQSCTEDGVDVAYLDPFVEILEDVEMLSVPDSKAYNALTYSAMRHNPIVTKWLTDHGLRSLTKGARFETKLYVSIIRNDIDALEELLGEHGEEIQEYIRRGTRDFNPLVEALNRKHWTMAARMAKAEERFDTKLNISPECLGALVVNQRVILNMLLEREMTIAPETFSAAAIATGPEFLIYLESLDETKSLVDEQLAALLVASIEKDSQWIFDASLTRLRALRAMLAAESGYVGIPSWYALFARHFDQHGKTLEDLKSAAILKPPFLSRLQIEGVPFEANDLKLAVRLELKESVRRLLRLPSILTLSEDEAVEILEIAGSNKGEVTKTFLRDSGLGFQWGR